MNKNITRKFALLVILSALAFAFSCRKDEEVFPVESAKAVSFCIKDSIHADMSYTITDSLSNVLSITAEIKGKNKAKRAEFYIDGDLVADDREAPFLFFWNTLKEQDGSHTFKTVFYDKKENKIESVSNLIVNNVLLNLQYNSVYGETFVVLSDEKGGIISKRSIKGGLLEEAIKPTVPFYQKKFNLTLATINGGNAAIYSHLSLKKGTVWREGFQAAAPIQKDVLVHVKNADSHGESYIVSNYYSYRIDNSQANSDMIIPIYEGGKLYVEVLRGDKIYYDVLDVNGSEIDIDLANISKESSSITIPTVIGANTTSYRYGIIGNQGREDGYFLASRSQFQEKGSITFQYPSTGFDKYLVGLSAHSSGNKTYSYDVIGEMPSVFITIQADVQTVDPSLGKFKGVFTGAFDNYTNFYLKQSSGQFYTWKVIAPYFQTSYVLPEISDIAGIPTLAHNGFSLTNIHLVDFVDFQEHPDYFGYYTNFPTKININRRASLNKSFTTSNQRSITQVNMMHEKVKQFEHKK